MAQKKIEQIGYIIGTGGTMATGADLVNLALQHLGEQYVLGAVAPKNDPNWSGPWDCAELVSWCVFQSAGVLYGCADNEAHPALADAYTGAWGRDARTLGVEITIQESLRTPGAALLRLGSKIGHVAISDGTGFTVEAHSTNKGVITSTAQGRRWDLGVLVPGIEYAPLTGQAPEYALPHGTVYRYTYPFMTGPMVRRIQEALQSRGHYLGSRPDGIFGPMTQLAVIEFQTKRGLVRDGEVGMETLKALGL